ncbi:hypothetical protein [Mycobacteroides abscessus]|uniref:hypothetical protein n=1 Tax=Mycobacteroides abscessus TaxID=36809 RepID=UPI00092BBFAD|nr:hypothetical protein [Mycobacteroides abscessus]MBE5440190.1 hypothetical protein [Mycobacteroides abscessus]SID45934.1 Uncharacterised protein [Mycobacteroides abscessus subsp. abscessus]SIG28067.1 Uncharacterised protein [Mycobacteroides abscessus subsp. abscessus]SIL96906.1 Uncharacterised protein [Mycobacteroides abscessus subsp. abscessus]SKU08443.1 Uncharacterised protein [Mycobacteroides abscessus subsp. abscessus]
MPRYRNTVGGSVVNIDDGLATRLGITENPHWEPLDERGALDPITPEDDAPAITETDGSNPSPVPLSDILPSATVWTATVPNGQAASEADALPDAPAPDQATPVEAKAPTRGKSGRKPSNEPEEVKDASGSD